MRECQNAACRQQVDPGAVCANCGVMACFRDGSDALLPDERLHVKEQRRINAIKLYRARTGASLKVAFEVVMKEASKYPIQYQTTLGPSLTQASDLQAARRAMEDALSYLRPGEGKSVLRAEAILQDALQRIPKPDPVPAAPAEL